MGRTSKVNMELIARCIYNKETGKAELENYSKYYLPRKERTV